MGPPPSRPVSARTSVAVVIGRFNDLLARGLRELIENDPNLAIVAADVEHGRIPVVLRAHQPDVAILDAGAFVKFAEVRDLCGRYPATRLVLLANDPSIEECSQLLAFGASACLGKDTQSRDILNAVHLASRGLRVIPQATSKPDRRSIAGGHLLTRREAEVLPLLQQGRSNAEIALALHVSVETVRTHARNIYRKLGVSSRRELAALPAPDQEREPGRAARWQGRRPATLMTRARRGGGSRHT
jgi:DNA-binding NarL/FixJ family response regulator